MGNLVNRLSPCRGYLCFENGTCAGEPLTASGLSKSANNPSPTIVFCPNRQDRCERCAWLHALGKLTTSNVSPSQANALISRVETDHGNRDWNAAQIGDLNPETNLFPSVGVDSGNGGNLNTQLVVIDGSPSVDDAQNRTEKPKRSSSDGCNQCHVVFIERHTRMTPNIVFGDFSTSFLSPYQDGDKTSSAEPVLTRSFCGFSSLVCRSEPHEGYPGAPAAPQLIRMGMMT